MGRIEFNHFPELADELEALHAGGLKPWEISCSLELGKLGLLVNCSAF